MQYRVVSVEYFMDHMQPWEADEILDVLDWFDQPGWEMTRMNVFSNVAPFSKRAIRPQDVMRFPWERPQGLPTDISDEDIKRLKDKA